MYNRVDQNNLVQFKHPEHFLALYKSVSGGLETMPEKMVIRMLKGSIRLTEDKAKVMNTQKQIMGYMNEKYMGGSNVVMITFGD